MLPRRSRYFESLNDMFNKLSDEDGMRFINENGATDFHEFLHSLEISNLGTTLMQGNLRLKPYTGLS